ncbi:MAG: hypothetical protein ACTSRR_09465 [Candidatus Heimdallarchaeaceae archaeon]
MYSKKKEKDYHRQLTQKRRSMSLYSTAVKLAEYGEAEASIKTPQKRKTSKYVSKNWSRWKSFVQIICTVLGSSILYVIALKKYPTNSLVYLFMFTILGIFTVNLGVGLLFKYLSSGAYSISRLFFEFFYIIAIIVATISALYLPTVIVLLVVGKSVDWLKYLFIIAIIVFPIAYVIGLLFNHIKETGLSVREYFSYHFNRERKNEEKRKATEQIGRYNDFYRGLNRIQENYNRRTSRKLRAEDLVSSSSE